MLRESKRQNIDFEGSRVILTELQLREFFAARWNGDALVKHRTPLVNGRLGEKLSRLDTPFRLHLEWKVAATSAIYKSRMCQKADLFCSLHSAVSRDAADNYASHSKR
jgi:hypothetical protein